MLKMLLQYVSKLKVKYIWFKKLIYLVQLLILGLVVGRRMAKIPKLAHPER
jgi:hypothetical protein